MSKKKAPRARKAARDRSLDAAAPTEREALLQRIQDLTEENARLKSSLAPEVDDDEHVGMLPQDDPRHWGGR